MGAVIVKMDEVRTDSVHVPRQEIRVDEAQAPAVEALVNHTYDLAKKLDESEVAKSELQGRADGMEAQNKELQEKLDSQPEPPNLQEAVKERIGLESTACFVKMDSAGIDKMDNLELMSKIILKQNKDLKLDSETEGGKAYIKARYDIIAEEAAKSNKGVAQLAQLGQATRQDANPEQKPSARDNFMQNGRDAWKGNNQKKEVA